MAVLHLVPRDRSLLRPASELLPRLRFDFVRGTLLELGGTSGAACTTTAVRLAREAQAAGEPVVWIERDDAGVHEPDLARAALDLDALVFVRTNAAEGPRAIVRAAELALRSGGIGFVFLDLDDGIPEGAPAAWQGRLLGLAREHRAAVVIRSRRPRTAESLGPLVSLRVVPERLPRRPHAAFADAPTHPRARRGQPFEVAFRVTKWKHGNAGTGAFAIESHPAPAGL